VREKYGDKVYDFGVTDSIDLRDSTRRPVDPAVRERLRWREGVRALAAKVLENHR